MLVTSGSILIKKKKSLFLDRNQEQKNRKPSGNKNHPPLLNFISGLIRTQLSFSLSSGDKCSSFSAPQSVKEPW